MVSTQALQTGNCYSCSRYNNNYNDLLLNPNYISALVNQPVCDTVSFSGKTNEKKSLWTRFLEFIGVKDSKKENTNNISSEYGIYPCCNTATIMSDQEFDDFINYALSSVLPNTSKSPQYDMYPFCNTPSLTYVLDFAKSEAMGKPVYRVSFNGTPEQQTAFINSLKQ